MKRVIESLESNLSKRIEENKVNDKHRTKSEDPENQNVFDKAFEINNDWIYQLTEAIGVLNGHGQAVKEKIKI